MQEEERGKSKQIKLLFMRKRRIDCKIMKGYFENDVMLKFY